MYVVSGDSTPLPVPAQNASGYYRLGLSGFRETEDFIGKETLLAFIQAGFDEAMFERAVYANPPFGQSHRNLAICPLVSDPEFNGQTHQ